MARLVEVARPVPPIFVVPTDGGGDLFVYFKVFDAESELEPIDVANHEYELYDVEGRELSASIDGRRTVISADGLSARDVLTEHLRRFFHAIDVQMPSQSDWRSFAELSAATIEEWESHRRGRRQ